MKLLDRIESIGNRLPHPVTLFVIGTVLIMLLSQLADSLQWQVINPVTKSVLEANSLISFQGIWWLLSHMVENFIKFPPLGIVLTGMLGIGMAERSGFLPALLKRSILLTPQSLLTPATIFLGIMSSMALDAGYVVLPPLAATLYIVAGRSPLTGIAAAFAGVSAGFSANLLITPLDPLLAGFTQAAATIISPDYQVAVTANWWFMIVSTLVLTMTGWLVTAKWIEPRIKNYEINEIASDKSPVNDPQTDKALYYALLTLVITLLIVLLTILLPGAPLFGKGTHFARWIEVTVPLLFLIFFIPGVVYGLTTGHIKNDKDIAKILGETFADLGPYIVLAFFAAQFIEGFKYSGLGEMLAISGGQILAASHIPAPVLLGSFIVLVMFANLFIGSASAKYAFLAPVFVPMLMLAGFSPELTQSAYRVGDSVTNVITPLNPYMIIILAQVQKYVRGSGMGTLVAVMLPYTIAFTFIWMCLLIIWFIFGLSLGPGASLHFNL